MLQDNFVVKIEAGGHNVTIDLSQEPAAFPEPTLFRWNRDGRPLSDTDPTLTLSYSNVSINTVTRADAGNYTVTATNFILPGSPEGNQVGNNTGSFYLDVLCKYFVCVQCIWLLRIQNHTLVQTMNSIDL